MTPGLFNLLAAVTLSWSYQPAGHFADPGPCDSAAREGRIFVLGCRLGVWMGGPADLQLVLPCTVREGQPNRVRGLGDGRFVASTACGLFLLDTRGTPRRLPFPGGPGALDADRRGRMVLANRQGLWRIDGSGQARFLAGLGETEPEELQLTSRHVLIRGTSRQLFLLESRIRREATGWGSLAIFDPGRLLLVHPSGRYWNVAIGADLEEGRRLPLEAGERVTRLCPLGSRVALLTSRRVILIEDQGWTAGRLPPASQRPVPVRGAVAGPPWMAAEGVLFYPVEQEAPDAGARLGRLFQAAIGYQGLRLPDQTPCPAGWLPRLQISLFGGRSRALDLTAENDWRFSNQGSLGFAVGLVWSLDEPFLCRAECRRWGLLRTIRRERRELEERLAGLLEALGQHCRRGDRLGIQQIRAHLKAVTGREVPCRRAWLVPSSGRE